MASLLMQLGIERSCGLITHAVRHREEPWPDTHAVRYREEPWPHYSCSWV